MLNVCFRDLARSPWNGGRPTPRSPVVDRCAVGGIDPFRWQVGQRQKGPAQQNLAEHGADARRTSADRGIHRPGSTQVDVRRRPSACVARSLEDGPLGLPGWVAAADAQDADTGLGTAVFSSTALLGHAASVVSRTMVGASPGSARPDQMGSSRSARTICPMALIASPGLWGDAPCEPLLLLPSEKGTAVAVCSQPPPLVCTGPSQEERRSCPLPRITAYPAQSGPPRRREALWPQQLSHHRHCHARLHPHLGGPGQRLRGECETPRRLPLHSGTPVGGSSFPACLLADEPERFRTSGHAQGLVLRLTVGHRASAAPGHQRAAALLPSAGRRIPHHVEPADTDRQRSLTPAGVGLRTCCRCPGGPRRQPGGPQSGLLLMVSE